MARFRFALLFILALLALAVGAAPASALTPPQRVPFFVPAPQSPFDVGRAPTAVMSGNFDAMGRGFEKNLLIGSTQGTRARLFYADRHRPGLRKLGWFRGPSGPSLLAGDPGNLAILSPASDQARYFEIDIFGDTVEGTAVVETGPEPVAAIFGDFIYGGTGWNRLELAVADHRTGQLQLFSGDGSLRKPLRLAATIPLGPEPTAVVGHPCCGSLIFATTAGDDRLALLSGFTDDGPSERRSFPVGGSRPVAIAVDDFVRGDYGDAEVAVANRGSDDVTILDAVGRTYDFRLLGTYPVGREPADLEALDVDHRDGLDLAVVDAGSDEVSILLGDGHGGFHSGGTYPTGDRPVSLAAFRFNQSFGPDLAIVNRRSGDLTVLLRHVDGSCRGREAQREYGTDGPDHLSGLGQGANETKGFGGDDRLGGGTGGDCLSGGPGEDVIRGGSQGDLIDGGAGDDELYGEGLFGGALRGGDDTIVGGPGRDRIEAGPGADQILARDREPDRIDCGRGRDLATVDRFDKVTECERVLER
jgi:RTX calcium-binding nonapeptide repeat (4 copies)